MDNLTHTLIGMVAGEAAARTLPVSPQGLPETTRRHALIAMGMIGGNLPDLDLAWSLQRITGDKLGYLLHHRGHTHTLLGCLALAALLYLGVRLWLRWRRQMVDGRDAKLLAVAALCAVLLHLGMDALNSYGVHPFWPLDNRWYYGDAIFIVEPLFWLATAPLLLASRSGGARIALGLVLLATCGLLSFAHLSWLRLWSVPVSVLLVLMLVLWGRRLSPRAAALTSGMLMLGMTASFAVAGRVADQRLAALAAQAFPEFRTLDRVLSPAPAHPFCWDVLLVQRSDDRYVVRKARLSLLPSLDARQCPNTNMNSDRTFRPAAVAARNTREIRWYGDFGMSQRELAAVAGHGCVARGMMQFLRVPFVTMRKEDWILGDLRFDREGEEGFAEERIVRDGDPACRYDLPWTPPRNDLLEPS